MLRGSESPVSTNCNLCLDLLIDNFVFTEIEKISESADKNKRGLGLGIFIGKTLLEKNAAKLVCRNSKTRLGAEVIISWKNTFLKNI